VVSFHLVGQLGESCQTKQADASADRVGVSGKTDSFPSSHSAAASGNLRLTDISYCKDTNITNQWALSMTLMAFFYCALGAQQVRKQPFLRDDYL
jgi:hypothetical protein